MIPDLAAPIRAAIIDDYDLANMIAPYLDSVAVFTRRPAPAIADYPMVMIGPDFGTGDADAVNSRRYELMRDVAVYGLNDEPENYRQVEDIARRIANLFHRQKRSLVIPGYRVWEITASGPMPAPVDDEQTVGRVVTLSILVQADA